MQRSVLKILTAILFTLAVSAGRAQLPLPTEFYFTHMEVEDGLPQNTVLCILQDRIGFMWFGTKDGLARYDGSKFRNFRHDADNPYSLGNNFIHSLYEDGEGYMWIGTNEGVFIYDPKKENFTPFDIRTEDGKTITNEVNCITGDGEGNLWFGVNMQGLFRYNPHQTTLMLYKHIPGDESSLSYNNVNALCMDADGNLWTGSRYDGGLDMYDAGIDSFIKYDTGNSVLHVNKIVRDNHDMLLIGTADNGLHILNPHLKTIRPLFERGEYGKLNIRDIFILNNNEIIIGTDNGMYIYNYISKKMRHITPEFDNPHSLLCKIICSIYRDKEGGMWFGTYFGGVNYFFPQSARFENFYPSDSPGRLSGKVISEFVEDFEGIIWIGTEDNGLYRFDSSTRFFTKYNTGNSELSDDNIRALYADGNDIYIGFVNGNIDILNRRSGKITSYKLELPDTRYDNIVFSFLRDRNGMLWVGTSHGVYIFDEPSGSFRKVETAGNYNSVYDIYQGADGTIYFAFYNVGVACYNPYYDRWSMLECDGGDMLKNVIDISENSDLKIWFGTEGEGVVGYNPETGEMKQTTTKEGLPNDVIYKIIEDMNKNLWLSTNNGLACYDPYSGTIKTYTSDNGLTSNQFNYSSGISDSNGKFYFGTVNGFVSFIPEEFTISNNISPIILTRLKLGEQQAEIDSRRSPLKASMPYTNRLELRYNQSTFTIDFALLSYNALSQNRYRYIMRNYTKEWSQPTLDQSVSFLNIPPGQYVFEVQGANSDGIWNDESAILEIEIMPPLYASTLAYIIYILLGISAVWLYVHWYLRKMREKNNRRAEDVILKHEREEYESKIDFFTNITHEIRTPLSLIKGPYEQIIKPSIKPSDYQENIEIMGSNIDRLLQLSNQLLDIRKIESERFVLHKTNFDLNVLIGDCMLPFTQRINQKNIQFDVSIPDGKLIMHADREVMTKIIGNILDNAIKYSKNKIKLRVVPDDISNTIVIHVGNDGDPIPVEYHEKIFEAFFQIKGNATGGTGLGLPLVKHLIEQHEGSIWITNDRTFTTFIMELPWVAAVTDETNACENGIVEREVKPIDRSVIQNHVLVIEDDIGMQDFLRRLLSQTYAVSLAGEADVAFEILNANDVDLIISDIMMPGMNGFEFCKFIKSRIEYSHIPVVILSVKSDNESKVMGLDAGADAYIEKPFSGDYLIAQISTILANGFIRRRSFSNQPFSSTSLLTPNKADQVFLNRVSAFVNENVSESEFNVEDLARLMAMSRSNLHRKIKGLLQMTPNEFIRLLRLRKAAELLSDGEYRINEICYMTGFNSSSYFTKCFQKQFGIRPKEFIKHNTSDIF